MRTYKVTVFEPNGEKLLDESFEAKNDTEGKEKGHKILEEHNALNKTHRCCSPEGKLLLYHP